MSRELAIPPKLHEIMLEWHGEGLSGQAITERLQAEYNVVACSQTVLNTLGKLRAAREEVAKGVLRKELAGTLTRDMSRLEESKKAMCRQIVNSEHDPKLQALCIETLRKLIETTLKYSGADEAEERRSVVIYRPPESDD